MHYLLWLGWVLPWLTQPGSSNTGGALLGMFLLFAEPPLCVLLVFSVEVALLMRRMHRRRLQTAGCPVR